jgi:hypothetical protein
MTPSSEIRPGIGEKLELWARTHTGSIALLGLLLAVATIVGAALGWLTDAWSWVYDREWAAVTLSASLAMMVAVVAIRSARLRRTARRRISQLESELRGAPRIDDAPDPAEQQQLLEVELNALKRQAEQTGLIVAWEAGWRYRIRKPGGTQRNLVTIPLNRSATQVRTELREALRNAESRLREQGMRISPDLLRDP